MMRRPGNVRPATLLHYPLAVFAGFVGLIFGLQVVSLLILIDLGLRMIAGAIPDDGPVIRKVEQVRVTVSPPPPSLPRGVVARPATGASLDRAAAVVMEELGAYPRPLLRRIPLRRVVLCSMVMNSGRRVEGLTFAGRGVILLDVGRAGTEGFRHVFHHEVAHVIEDALPGGVERDRRWSGLNPGDFAYGEAEVVQALEVLGEDPAGRPDLPGFLSFYAMASPREDRAEVFAAMMVRPGNTRDFASEDPILRAKWRLLRSDLIGWDPGFVRALEGR